MKVYLTQINESWIVDKIREEFYLNFSEIAIIFKGIMSGDEKAHKSRPIKPI